MHAMRLTCKVQHAGYIRAEDPSRPVHYEGGGFTTPATDIICPMYARVAQIEAFAAMAPESERRPGVTAIDLLVCPPACTLRGALCAKSYRTPRQCFQGDRE
jgi:beta-galactosidase/beta-glucuronidase